MKWDPRDVVGYDAGDMVKYLGCSDDQIRFGNYDDPRPYLDIGKTYEVESVKVHEWHTEVELVGYAGLKFNSVCFEGEGSEV